MSRTRRIEPDPYKWHYAGKRKFRNDLQRPETKQEANQRVRRRVRYVIKTERIDPADVT